MGLSSALKQSMLPETLSMIQGLINEDAERRRQEEKRKITEKTVGEITRMFSSLPDNPTIEQLNNVSKQAMMLAFKEGSEDALKVIDPLRGMAAQETEKAKELKTSHVLSEFFGISGESISEVPPTLMLESVRMAEAMKQKVQVRDREGRSYLKVYDQKGRELKDETITIDSATNDDRFNQWKKEQDFLRKARMDEYRLSHSISEGSPYQFVGTSDGMGLVLNKKTGSLEQSEIKVDAKGQAKIKLGQYSQAVNIFADDIINTVINSDENAMQLFSDELAASSGKVDKESFLEKLYSKGFMDSAKEKGIISKEKLEDYWKAKYYRSQAAGEVSGLGKEKTKKKVEGF